MRDKNKELEKQVADTEKHARKRVEEYKQAIRVKKLKEPLTGLSPLHSRRDSRGEREEREERDIEEGRLRE